ncbi:hypothetical protein KBY57_10345 [Cyanobium sp. Aljojuca 7D2]|uniref:hypothetical protein n=1 Tax=Cyanobium sp. Aljojuca 7D2 TaxID=2823698 RepID=UPI0020CD7E64|nr:hypothetical protein [Cyanobium sp. Aljojuca 7D2]MCP9891452.1 hypothetical protein [Cyanobium sp. Aljojuca 7D2]
MTSFLRHDLADPAIPEGMVRITQDGRHRFIWPVHLGGWQSLGWQLQPAADLPAPEPRLPEPELEPEPDPDLPPDPDLVPDPEAELAELDVQTSPAVEESDPSPATDLMEPEPLPAGTDFQAMTKAQILEHCSSVYGVDLDGSQTKAELVEQATALELQSAPLNDEPLADGLLDLDDPLI